MSFLLGTAIHLRIARAKRRKKRRRIVRKSDLRMESENTSQAMDGNVTVVVQSRENDIDAVEGNGVGGRSAEAASDGNVL